MLGDQDLIRQGVWVSFKHQQLRNQTLGYKKIFVMNSMVIFKNFLNIFISFKNKEHFAFPNQVICCHLTVFWPPLEIRTNFSIPQIRNTVANSSLKSCSMN